MVTQTPGSLLPKLCPRRPCSLPQAAQDPRGSSCFPASVLSWLPTSGKRTLGVPLRSLKVSGVFSAQGLPVCQLTLLKACSSQEQPRQVDRWAPLVEESRGFSHSLTIVSHPPQQPSVASSFLPFETGHDLSHSRMLFPQSLHRLPEPPCSKPSRGSSPL